MGRCVGAPVGSSEGLRMYVLMMEMMIVEVLVGLEVVYHSYNY